MNKVNLRILTAVTTTFVEEIVEEVANAQANSAIGTSIEVLYKIPHTELRMALGVKRITREVKDALYMEVSKYPYIRVSSNDRYTLLSYVPTVIETTKLIYTHH